jgi:hypothetical protein
MPGSRTFLFFRPTTRAPLLLSWLLPRAGQLLSNAHISNLKIFDFVVFVAIMATKRATQPTKRASQPTKRASQPTKRASQPTNSITSYFQPTSNPIETNEPRHDGQDTPQDINNETIVPRNTMKRVREESEESEEVVRPGRHG